KTLNEILGDRVTRSNENNWDSPRSGLRRFGRRIAVRKDYLGFEFHQTRDLRLDPFEIAHTPAKLYQQIGPDPPTARLEALAKSLRSKLSFPVALRVQHQNADATHPSRCWAGAAIGQREANAA